MSLFPTVRATDLDGRAYDVPAGLPAGPQVLLVAFKRWQQVLIEMWKARLRPLEREFSCLSVWEVHVLSRAYAPARPFIDGGMRAGITEPAVRRRTLTAYVDLDSFASALGLDDFETVHAFLIGPDGEVVWHASGKPESEAVASLAEVLAWLSPGS